MTCDSPFRYQYFIPFHLCDAAGILFFGHVFTLAHQAFEHFVVHQINCPWEMWFKNTEWIIPIKEATANYFHPLKAGKECQIDMQVSSLSHSSFKIKSSFHQQEYFCCQVDTVHVFCDSVSKKKIPIPQSLFSCLENNLHKFEI